MNNWYIFPGQKVTPTLLILLGTLMIGGGGLVATYGWNKRSELNRRQGMIHAMAAECQVNWNFFRDLEARSNAETIQMLPRLRTFALDAAISSGIFSSGEDKKLYSFMTLISARLYSFNRWLDRNETIPFERTGGAKTVYADFARRPHFVAAQRDFTAFVKFIMDEFGFDASYSPFVDIDGDIAKIIRDLEAAAKSSEQQDDAAGVTDTLHGPPKAL